MLLEDWVTSKEEVVGAEALMYVWDMVLPWISPLQTMDLTAQHNAFVAHIARIEQLVPKYPGHTCQICLRAPECLGCLISREVVH